MIRCEYCDLVVDAPSVFALSRDADSPTHPKSRTRIVSKVLCGSMAVSMLEAMLQDVRYLPRLHEQEENRE